MVQFWLTYLRLLVQACLDLRLSRATALDVDCVIAFSFGDGNPGEYNAYLADHINKYYADKKVICQREIGRGLAEKVDAAVITHHDPEITHELDTREVVRQAAQIMGASSMESAAVVAHPLHAARVAYCVADRGVEVAIPSGLKVSWPQDSTQSRTHSRPRWIAHEVTAIFRELKRAQNSA